VGSGRGVIPLPPDYVKLVDTQTPGARYDVTPLFGDYEAFSSLVDDLVVQLASVDFDLVAGIDALGFILGTALAMRTRKGFLPIRKGGKLPVVTDAAEFTDYSGQRKALELRRDAIRPGTRMLVVDEWIETGAQVRAAIQLIEGQGGIVAGVATIHIDTNPETERITRRYPCFQVWLDA
jgi:adenine phosphoribosyltransferase